MPHRRPRGNQVRHPAFSFGFSRRAALRRGRVEGAKRPYEGYWEHGQLARAFFLHGQAARDPSGDAATPFLDPLQRTLPPLQRRETKLRCRPAGGKWKGKRAMRSSGGPPFSSLPQPIRWGATGKSHLQLSIRRPFSLTAAARLGGAPCKSCPELAKFSPFIRSPNVPVRGAVFLVFNVENHCRNCLTALVLSLFCNPFCPFCFQPGIFPVEQSCKKRILYVDCTQNIRR